MSTYFPGSFIEYRLSDNAEESSNSINVCADLKFQSDLKVPLKSVNSESLEKKMQFTKRLSLLENVF